MGTYDREYTRQKPRQLWDDLPPVTKWLIVLNLVIFFGDILLFKPRRGLEAAFSIDLAFRHGELWRLISFQFLHANVLHVVVNCLGLYVFGPWMERWWGSVRFLGFYLLCGIAGAAFFSLLMVLNIVPGSFDSELVGASAGLYGIIIGAGLVAPDLRVMLLFPPIEMSMRQLAWAALAITVAIVLFNLGDNSGGEAGHLGGAILGFLLVKMPGLLGKRSGAKPARPARPRGEPKLKPRTRIDLDAADEIDRILEKVHREGLQSLTAAEKQSLQDASNKR